MDADLRRAARLSLVPGQSAADVSRATGISVAAIRRARKDPALALRRDDLVLAALTERGTKTEGVVDEAQLSSIASWLDYVNHDGSTAAGVRADLERLSASGVLALEGARFRLLVAWP